MTTLFVLLSAFLCFAVVLIVLAYFVFHSKKSSPPIQPLHRHQSVLEVRMADVMRAQAPREDAHAQQARRRQFAAGDHPRRPGSFHGSPSSQNSAYSVPREDSPLLGLGVPVSGEEKMEAGSDYGDSDTGSRRTTHSNAPTTMSAADEALLGTFMEVLSEGLPVKIHRTSGRARKVTLWLKDRDTLVWFSKRTIGTKKWHKLSLRGVTTVQPGKSTTALQGGSSLSVSEALCLSLVFPSLSLGLEASSELERDALMQGFCMLVEDLKAAEELLIRDVEAGIRTI